MHHLIIGYGYCGYYLAQHLLAQQQTVTVLSRHIDKTMHLVGINHLIHDIKEPFNWQEKETCLYYLIPPTAQSHSDLLLEQFLTQSSIEASRVIYFGSSGVYGDHHGEWVNEESPCLLIQPRQYGRINAERQWLAFCKQQAIPCTLLRIAGIYGPGRLPIKAAISVEPLINPHEAPYTNSIYVNDLAEIAYQLACTSQITATFNIADGVPQPMGTLQRLVAEELNLPSNFASLESVWQTASPMKREFMSASKRLLIDHLKTTLEHSLKLTPLKEAIRESLAETDL